MLVIFLLVGLFRLLAEATTVELAYVILGGLFLIVGAFLWSKRDSSEDRQQVGGERQCLRRCSSSDRARQGSPLPSTPRGPISSR